MRDKFARFMSGRNGNDQLNIFLLAVDVVLLILALFFAGGFGKYLNLLVLAVMGCVYFRMFSRNLCKRREENGKYMRLRYRFSAAYRVRRERWVQRKDYKFFTCPACRTTLRVPRGHGKIKVVCRKCGCSFTGKS